MDFTALRDNVERVAATAAKETGKDAVGTAVLTVGQTLVGMYEELAGIRQALQQRKDND